MYQQLQGFFMSLQNGKIQQSVISCVCFVFVTQFLSLKEHIQQQLARNWFKVSWDVYLCIIFYFYFHPITPILCG